MKRSVAIKVIGRMPASLKRKTSRAFTMVEVALALGVMTVGIVAILGLLPSAFTSARTAADNTITATIVQDLFSTLRAQPYANINLWGKTINLTVLNTATLNFDQAGNQTNSATYTSYYKVVVTNTPQAMMSSVYVNVVWPAWSTSAPNTNLYTTTIANYR